MHGDPEALFAA
jgi:hypothetical protein